MNTRDDLPITRSLGWCACVAAALSSCLFAQARARADELAHGLAQGALEGLHGDGRHGSRRIQLNGLRLRVEVRRARAPLAGVLDAFEEHCRERNAPAEQPFPLGPWPDAGVLARRGAHSGWVACLDPGARRLTPERWVERARRFVARGDLAELGELRLLWARRERDDTLVVSLRSDGSVPLWGAFPRAQDAPGGDLPALPRPPRSRRVLSAAHDGAAPRVAGYVSELAPAQALARHRAGLQRAGFTVAEAAADRDARYLFATRAGRSAVIAFEADGERTLIAAATLE